MDGTGTFSRFASAPRLFAHAFHASQQSFPCRNLWHTTPYLFLCGLSNREIYGSVADSAQGSSIAAFPHATRLRCRDRSALKRCRGMSPWSGIGHKKRPAHLGTTTVPFILACTNYLQVRSRDVDFLSRSPQRSFKGFPQLHFRQRPSSWRCSRGLPRKTTCWDETTKPRIWK